MNTMMKLSISILLCSVGLVPPAVGQSTRSFDRVTAALMAVQQTHGILTGLEIAAKDGANKGGIVLDLPEIDTTRLLDMLVKQRPLYVWHRDDIVYNLYPMQKSKSLAQVSIADFVVADATLQQVHDAISNLPEVRRWVMRHHAITVGAPGSGSIVSVAGVMPEPKRISLSLHNVQLCTILNQVIRGFGEWRWVIGTYSQVTGASEPLYIDF